MWAYYTQNTNQSRDLDLLPLAVWPTGVLLATVWASWLLIGCPKGWFSPPPTPLHPTPPIPLLIPPTPSIVNTDGRKGQQKVP